MSRTMRRIVVGIASVLVMLEVGESHGEGNYLSAVESPPPPGRTTIVSSKTWPRDTGSESIPSVAASQSYPVVAAEVFQPNGSNRLVQSASSGPPGFLKGTPGYAQWQSAESADETFRDLLKEGQNEPNSLALYCYLLFGNRGHSDFDQKVAAMKAYLSDFGTLKEMSGVPANKRAGFFVFTSMDAEWIDQCTRDDFVLKVPTWKCSVKNQTRNWTLEELAEWVVARYDYTRARMLIKKLEDLGFTNDMEGIFLVSYLRPIGPTTSPDNSPYILFQNLSKMPPDYMESWVRLTKRQFTKRNYWDKDTLRAALLEVRTVIAQFAPIVELTERAMGSPIKLVWPKQ